MICRCQNCPQEITFAECRLGETVTCPSCGMDTILLAPPRHEDPTPEPPPLRRKWTWRTWFGVASLTIILLGLVIGGIYVAKQVAASQLLDGAGMAVQMVVSLGVLFAILYLAACWLLFPVLVYHLLRRISADLAAVRKHVCR